MRICKKYFSQLFSAQFVRCDNFFQFIPFNPITMELHFTLQDYCNFFIVKLVILSLNLLTTKIVKSGSFICNKFWHWHAHHTHVLPTFYYCKHEKVILTRQKSYLTAKCIYFNVQMKRKDYKLKCINFDMKN